MLESWDWKEQAACKTHTNIFYPVGRKSPKYYDRVAEICFECPVMEQCRRFAETNGEQYGVWGGKDFESTLKAKRLARLHKHRDNKKKKA